MLEVTATRINARLQPLRKLLNGCADMLLRGCSPGLLQLLLQLFHASIILPSHLLFQDRPDGIIEGVEIRTRGRPDISPPETPEVLLAVRQRGSLGILEKFANVYEL